MKRNPNILRDFFSLIQLQILHYHFLNNVPLEGLLVSIYCAIIAYSLLSARLEQDKKNDYFPDLKKYGKEEQAISVLLLGKEIEPESHEDEKEERYFRMSELSEKYRIFFSILIYFGVVLLSGYFLKSFFKADFINHLPYSVYFPMAILSLTLGTRSFSQLGIVPSLLFVLLVFSVPWESYSGLDIFIHTFLAVTFFLGGIKLSHEQEKNTYNIIYQTFTQVTPYSFFISILFSLCLVFFPSQKVLNPSQDKNPGIPQKINRSLGKMVSNQNLMNNLKRFKGNLNNLHMNSDKINSFFDQAERSMDMMEKFMDQFPNIDMGIQEKNILVNNQRVIQKQLKNEIAIEKENFLKLSPEKISADHLKKLNGLIKRIYENALKLQEIADKSPNRQNLPSLPKGNLEQDFHQSMNGYFKDKLKEEIGYIQDPKIKEEVKKLLTQKSRSKVVNNQKQDFHAQKNEALSSLQDRIEEEAKKENLIDPKFLEKLVSLVKYIIYFLLFVFILKALQKLLGKTQELPIEDQLTKEEKKMLLLKRKYQSDEEEIRTLFLQFSGAIKKLYFGEEEPPPPKIMQLEIQKYFPKKSKSLGYFLEVFSLSEYRSQKIPKEVLKKYRKAYKSLIQSL